MYIFQWSPPYMVDQQGRRLAGLQWENSNLGCLWPPIQRLAVWSFHWDHAVRASTCFQKMTRLARGHRSLSLGTYDAVVNLRITGSTLCCTYGPPFLPGGSHRADFRTDLRKRDVDCRLSVKQKFFKKEKKVLGTEQLRWCLSLEKTFY